ncbi:MAG: hypothetical protein LBR34_10615 [Prevotella sp.]|jgi:hypothetical protein|nr:hypothetical protein [Prevotella sp.]
MMKKIYRQLMMGAMLVASVGAAADETITIQDFQPEADGIVYNQNGIKVTVVKDDAQTSYTEDQTLQLGCLNVNGTIPALYLRKDLTVKAILDIEPTNAAVVISSVKFIGASYNTQSQSQFVLTYSMDGTTFPTPTGSVSENNPGAFYSTESGAVTSGVSNLLSKAVSFLASENMDQVCSSAAEYVIPETIYQGSVNGPRTTTYSRADVRKIRLIGTGAAGVSLSNNYNAYIYGIVLTLSGSYSDIDGAPAAEKTPLLSIYTDLTGRIIPLGTKGFLIKKTIYSDGSVANEKMYSR